MQENSKNTRPLVASRRDRGTISLCASGRSFTVPRVDGTQMRADDLPTACQKPGRPHPEEYIPRLERGVILRPVPATETDQTDRQHLYKMVQSQTLSPGPEGMSERVVTPASKKKKSVLLT